MFTSLIFSLTFFGVGFTSITNIEEGLIYQIIKLTYNQCIEKCESSLKCVSLKYYRSFTLCKLFETELSLSTHVPGYKVYHKSALQRQEHQVKYEVCDANDADVSISCTPLSCPPSHNILGATAFGNMFDIGSVIKYQCNDFEDYATSNCYPNGTWPPVLLPCACKNNSIFNYEVIGMTLTTITTERICPEETNLIRGVPPTCDLATGIWYNQQLSFCESIDSAWTSVFRIANGAQIPIRGAWKGKIEATIDTEDLMRSALIDDWENINVSQVKIVVHKDGATVLSLLFNACNSTNLNWFNFERLIENPWNDVLNAESVDTFSLEGSMLLSRFEIGSSSEGECHQSTGWFSVSKRFKTCPENQNTVEILYAPGMDPILYTNMERGDDFIVWIKHT
ncbi:hypothetical protein ACF0H5_016768 [Mactra antiquata]